MNSKKTILLTASYKGRPLEIVHELVPPGFSLVTMDTNSQEELTEKAPCADYILASGKMMIDRKVVDAAEKLRMVQRLGVGLDTLDFNALNSRAIPVYVNQGVNAGSVAEHAVMFILASLRRLPEISKRTKSGIWKKQEQGVTTRTLEARTVGIVGIGNIGRRVAGLLRGFGCRILYYDIYRLDGAVEEDMGIEYVDLEVLLSVSDVITLHCPLVPQTEDIICGDNLRRMKDGVIIINTSRGGLVKEADLLKALETGKVGYAALDVFEAEPIRNYALAKHPNVICTPHIAGNTFDAFSQMLREAFRNIALYDKGQLTEISKHLVSR